MVLSSIGNVKVPPARPRLLLLTNGNVGNRQSLRPSLVVAARALGGPAAYEDRKSTKSTIDRPPSIFDNPPWWTRLPIIGPQLSMLRLLRVDPIRFYRDAARSPITRLELFGSPSVIVSTATGVKEAFGAEARGDLVTAWPPTLVELMGKQTILHLEGDAHRHLRSLIMPAFSKASFVSYLPTMQAVMRRFVDTWRQTAGPEVPLAPSIREMIFEIAIRALIGDDVDSGRVNRYLKEFETFTRGLITSRWGTAFYSALQSRAVLLSMLGETMDARSEQLAAGETPKDTLTYLMTARDESGKGLSREAVLDNALTLIFAGHITTATAAVNLLAFVGSDQKIGDEITREWLAWPEERSAVDAPLDFDLLAASTCPALDRAVRESLRLAPPAVAAWRMATKDVIIGGETISANTRVLLSIEGAHQDARAFPQPMSYCPFRFTANSGRDVPASDPNAMIAFGQGAHVCAGRGMAELELKALMVIFQRDLGYKLVSGQDLSQTLKVGKGRLPASGLRIERPSPAPISSKYTGPFGC